MFHRRVGLVVHPEECTKHEYAGSEVSHMKISVGPDIVVVIIESNSALETTRGWQAELPFLQSL
jgi:hypothetical protein